MIILLELSKYLGLWDGAIRPSSKPVFKDDDKTLKIIYSRIVYMYSNEYFSNE